MMKNLLLLFFLLLFVLPCSALAEKKGDESLTLLNQPQKNAALQHQQPDDQPAELRDIRGPVELQKQSQTLIYAAVIAMLLFLILLTVLLLRRRKKPLAAHVPPWEKALSELTEARKLLSADLALHYMESVSLILRKYVESRFSIKSTRQTTREFLYNLNKSSADPIIKSCRGELQTCLEQCDMAKFAHQVPLHKNMEMVENAIINFIEKTRPDSQPKGESA